MRFWQDANGAIITDEQVLNYLACHGSLSESLQSGDIVLLDCVPDGGTTLPKDQETALGTSRSVHLDEYLSRS